jgi:hypothetical protein
MRLRWKRSKPRPDQREPPAEPRIRSSVLEARSCRLPGGPCGMHRRFMCPRC